MFYHNCRLTGMLNFIEYEQILKLIKTDSITKLTFINIKYLNLFKHSSFRWEYAHINWAELKVVYILVYCSSEKCVALRKTLHNITKMKRETNVFMVTLKCGHYTKEFNYYKCQYKFTSLLRRQHLLWMCNTIHTEWVQATTNIWT